MSNVVPLKQTHQAIVMNEAYFEKYSDDQLLYRAASACDLAGDALFDEGAGEDEANDARFEVHVAFMCLKELVKRSFGQPYGGIKSALDEAFMRRVFDEKPAEVTP